MSLFSAILCQFSAILTKERAYSIKIEVADFSELSGAVMHEDP